MVIMKRILCFGDSNTWGYIPNSDAERYPTSIRYPRVLASKLGEEYEVIEEGLPGRTLMCDNYKELVGNRNGKLSFGQVIYTHLPLDYILIMLGTNDLKNSYHKTAKELTIVLENDYLSRIKKKLNGKIKNNPKIIIVAPSIIKEGDNKFDAASIKESTLFNREYGEIAIRNDCLFIDNQGLETGSDGVHLTKESHLLLAAKIFQTIKDYETQDF